MNPSPLTELYSSQGSGQHNRKTTINKQVKCTVCDICHGMLWRKMKQGRGTECWGGTFGQWEFWHFKSGDYGLFTEKTTVEQGKSLRAKSGVCLLFLWTEASVIGVTEETRRWGCRRNWVRANEGPEAIVRNLSFILIEQENHWRILSRGMSWFHFIFGGIDNSGCYFETWQRRGVYE